MNEKKTFRGFLWKLASNFWEEFKEVFMEEILAPLVALVMFAVCVILFIIIIPVNWYHTIGLIIVYGVIAFIVIALILIASVGIWDTYKEYYDR